ncbi:electron transport complex protein RnfC [Pseudomonas aeruginosa]|nr:electron transport complex protein RnfC [Pseudomonas aeruginosa]
MNALHDFPGGLRLPANKRQSTALPIQQAPLAQRYVVPLAQHMGAPARPCVEVGQAVLKGETIALADGSLSAALHAPTSGRVVAIGEQPYPHASGLPAPAIVIDSDGEDRWTELQPCPDFRLESPPALLERIRAAGIGGLGGAGFPTAAKLAARPAERIHTLVVNGAECEPYISADDLLMRERATRVLGGIDILARILEPEEVLIGVEDDKPEAIAALGAALGERPYRIVVLPSRYPSGGERQLIQLLTGQEVPADGLPADIGILCQNVGTLAAVHDAVVLGRPLISRIVTLTGKALARPMNVEALIGTPVNELLAFAGLAAERLQRVLMGGPMMGFALPDLSVPLVKTCNCLLAGRCQRTAAIAAGHAVHPLRRLCAGLPGEPVAATVAFLRPGRRARTTAGPPPVRLHRVRRLRLRLPVGHPAGAVLPRVQGADPRAAAETAQGRAVPRTLRAAPGAPDARRGAPGGRSGRAGGKSRAGTRRPGRTRGSHTRRGGRPGPGGDRAGQGAQAGR